MKNAELDSVNFSNAQVDHQTEFGKKVVYEKQNESDNSFERQSAQNIKAIWTYRSLSSLTKQNALLERASHFYKKEKDLRRRQHKIEITNQANKNVLNEYNDQFCPIYRAKIIWNYIKAEASRYSIQYGESPIQLVLFSGFTVLLFGLLYPLFGIKTGRETIKYVFFSDGDRLGGFGQQISYAVEFLNFSFYTFVRVGVRDSQAIGFSRILAGFESVLGAAVIALLVFVLTRRATS
jgi:hypothetical protein